MKITYLLLLLCNSYLIVLSQPLFAGAVPNGLPSSSSDSIVYDDIGKGAKEDAPTPAQDWNIVCSDGVSSGISLTEICGQSRCKNTNYCKNALSTDLKLGRPSLPNDVETDQVAAGSGVKPKVPAPKKAAATSSDSLSKSKEPVSQAGTKESAKDPAKSTDSAVAAKTPTGDSTLDQATCQQLQQTAINCCTNPTPANCGYTDSGGNDASTYTVPPSSSSGLADYCAQMSAAGGTNNTANMNASAMCARHYTACKNTCSAFAQSYADQDVASTFSSKAQSCTSLASVGAQLGAQSKSSYNAANVGDACNQMAAAQAQSLGAGSLNSQTPNAMNSNDPYGCKESC